MVDKSEPELRVRWHAMFVESLLFSLNHRLFRFLVLGRPDEHGARTETTAKKSRRLLPGRIGEILANRGDISFERIASNQKSYTFWNN